MKFFKAISILYICLLGMAMTAAIGSAVFAQPLELDYPQVPGPELPSEIHSLPQYVRYLFQFAVALTGFIAFGALAYGGVRYVLSRGNASSMADAKEQVIAGFLGILLVLGAFMLLNTINPQLVTLKFAGESASRGIILCAGGGCSENPQGELGIDFIKLKGSISCVRCNYPDLKPIGSAFFFNSSDELEVSIYSNEDFGPDRDNPAWNSERDADFISWNTSVTVPNGNSVELNWKLPGIYLFTESNCQGKSHLFTQSSASFDQINFHDKARSFKIIPSITRKESSQQNLLAAIMPPGGPSFHVTEQLGVILHENSNYEYDSMVWLGTRLVNGGRWLLPSEDPNNRGCYELNAPCDKNKQPYCMENSSYSASSITVFKQVMAPAPDPDEMGEGITIFGNYQWNEQDPDDRNDEEQIHCGPINIKTNNGGFGPLGVGAPLWIDAAAGNIGEPKMYPGTPNESDLDCRRLFSGGIGKDSFVSSIKVNGNYIAILFRKDGRGEVFGLPERSYGGDYNLKQGNHIGNDTATAVLVIPVESR